MMITACGNEGRLRAEPLLQFEAEHAAIKLQRTLQVRHFQMNVADDNTRINWPRSGIFFHEFFLPVSRWNLCSARCTTGARTIPVTVINIRPLNSA